MVRLRDRGRLGWRDDPPDGEQRVGWRCRDHHDQRSRTQRDIGRDRRTDLVSGTAPVIDGRYVLWLPTSDTWERDTTITVRSLDTDSAVLATVEISVDAPPR